MANNPSSSALDAVELGPLPSEIRVRGAVTSAAAPSDHPSVAALVTRFGAGIVRHRVSAGDQTVVWVDPKQSLEILTWLKNDASQLYDMMSDVTGVDYGGASVDVVYQMFSTTHKRALRVRCELPANALEIDSVVGLWKSADWLEREVFDLFGVKFRGHPDLRRILMPDDYAEGNPLRKDFPLRGRFSRAEQTRRALEQDVERFYTATDLKHGGTPQQVTAGGKPAEGVD
ncbi:MAG: NADH-quinone oxidoreductase subunit C [Gemmatimonadetes bacterium]|nr:NADH-quinone oxidoreductase subunit C [Gemmatimonadota bacterium]